jgi:TIR domain
MATVHEYFVGDFTSTFTTHWDWTIFPVSGNAPPVTVVARAHWDSAQHTRFVSYFVAAEVSDADWALASLVQSARRVIEQAEGHINLTASHPVFDPDGTNMKDAPFSGRIFLYVDGRLSDSTARSLKRLAVGSDAALQIRDRAYADHRNTTVRPKAFICHDSRNKDAVVRPLAVKLQSMLCPVWYDEFSLKPGDSLRGGIDRGLAECPKCVVVLSRAFISNPGWSKGEFGAIMTRHFAEGGSVLIPIWHRVSRKAIAEYSPLVADIFALNTKVGTDELARCVYNAVSEGD